MTDDKQITEPYKSDNIKKEKFVEVYSRDEVRGNVSMSCSVVDISRDTYYRWIDEDEEFRKVIYESKMRMCDDMEQVLVSRAVDKSDTALIFWLKYNHPQYKEQPTNLTQVNIYDKAEKKADQFIVEVQNGN